MLYFPHMEKWNIIVVGGGHAGCEAALVSARMGMPTLLVTRHAGTLGQMPCNPAVGGLAKSHLVFELDALGGEMGVNTDATGLQYRVLNTSRGPAVQANRVQCDKGLYRRRLSWIIHHTPNLSVLEDEVTEILVTNNPPTVVAGVMTCHTGAILAGAVVLTTGTALGGRIHIGGESRPGGGDGRESAELLSNNLKLLGIPLFRLKTGTPPRIKRSSIRFDKMQEQPGTTPPPFFSWAARKTMGHCSTWNNPNNSETFRVAFPGKGFPVPLECSTWNISNGIVRPPTQLSCWQTHTTPETHRIIRENLKQSALYGGNISGTGVRYCPSIEDKIVKFPQAGQHHVVIEPEAKDSEWMYPNGTSNSLPRGVQEAMLRSIPGLEDVEFLQHGYAIEYDAVEPTTLTRALESKLARFLFCAGQINGTTGYEEAAAQGFMAGVNAVFAVRGDEPLVLERHEAYIGVMIDDLVTKGTNEPYRMFTSRAERRLLLRQDNARYRLAVHARRIGVVSLDFVEETEFFARLVQDESSRLQTTFTGQRSLFSILARPGMAYDRLPVAGQRALPREVCRQLEIQACYGGYIDQEERLVRRTQESGTMRLPEWLDYSAVSALRYEAREKLTRIRPDNLAQAARIPGITPADAAVLAVIIKRGKI